ncbi:MAG: fused MFS/spermidine synthase [Patescibacteria group bacterium]|nr:fused MFS/spermidine synthase [Patescibacteria group bacterium]
MSKHKPKLPYVIAFITGMCIMAIELTASRLLAPYFGTSLFVWTNIIAVIMLALAIGYWFGGRISERRPELSLLLKIILTAGLFCFIIPFAVEPLSMVVLKDFSGSAPASVLILVGSFFSTLILFFVPIMFLGMCSPFLIKLASIFDHNIGNISGRIFAISTVGSIVGTFLPSIVFIAWVGSKKTVLIFAVILIMTAAWGLARRKHYAWFGFFIFVAGPLFAPSALSYDPSIIYQTESVYQYIQVREREGLRELIYNEGTGTQSAYRLGSDLIGRMYFDVMSAIPAFFEKENIKILNIGLAGGTAVHGMLEIFPDKVFNIDGVEIDDKVIQVAKKYFDLDPAKVNIFNLDGRIFARTSEKKYDLILVDAYSNQLYIPWHLVTDEFFFDLGNILEPQGIIALNLNATSEESRLYRAITNTMAHNFKYVYTAPVADSFNYIIFCSDEPLEFDRLLSHPAIVGRPDLSEMIHYLSLNSKLVKFNSVEELLTDDRAPVEHMTDAMYFDYFTKELHKK